MTKTKTGINKKIEAPAEAKTTVKNSIFIIGGEKGGVGKSFYCRILLDYLINKVWTDSFVLVDADPVINDIAPIYSTCETIKIAFSDNRYAQDEPNVILDKVIEKTVIANLPSNVCQKFDDWVQRVKLLSKKTKQYYSSLTYFFICDGSNASIEQFKKQMKLYGESEFKHCLVMNPARCSNGDNFSYINDLYPELLEVLKKYKVPVVELPVFSSRLQCICDRDKVSYRDLLTQGAVCDRNQADVFLEEIDSLFDSIFIDNLQNPSGLNKIAEELSKKYEQGGFPFKTKLELFREH